MTASDGYRIPTETCQVEMVVGRSRFIATLGQANTVSDAKGFIDDVRQQMPDANHHVYAFRIGHGATVTEGMSDDGEPSGTSGPPSLAVLRGSDLGDVIVVITRYFGGKKLGKGGLVRAYSDVVRLALDTTHTEEKVEKCELFASVPYALYDPIRRIIEGLSIEITNESFMAEVAIRVLLPRHISEKFVETVLNETSGQVEFTLVENP